MSDVAEVKMKLEERSAAHAASLEEHNMIIEKLGDEIKKISAASKSLKPKPPASALQAFL